MSFHGQLKCSSDLVDDIRTLTVAPEPPDSLEEGPRLLSVAPVQAGHGPRGVGDQAAQVGVLWGRKGPVGVSECQGGHGGGAGERGGAWGRRGRCGRAIGPHQQGAVCSRVQAGMPGEGGRAVVGVAVVDLCGPVVLLAPPLSLLPHSHLLLLFLCASYSSPVILAAVLPRRVRERPRRPGRLAALGQDGEEVLDARGGEREVEPEAATGHEQQGLQQRHVGEEAREPGQRLVVAHLGDSPRTWLTHLRQRHLQQKHAC